MIVAVVKVVSPELQFFGEQEFVCLPRTGERLNLSFSKNEVWLEVVSVDHFAKSSEGYAGPSSVQLNCKKV